jgi:hypothetical protein
MRVAVKYRSLARDEEFKLESDEEASLSLSAAAVAALMRA